MGAGCRVHQRDSGRVWTSSEEVHRRTDDNKNGTFVGLLLTSSNEDGVRSLGGVQDSRLVQHGHGKGGQRSQMCCNERR